MHNPSGLDPDTAKSPVLADPDQHSLLKMSFKSTVRRDVTGSNETQTIRTDELNKRFALFINLKETPSREKQKPVSFSQL
jgi:hypothetical protein